MFHKIHFIPVQFIQNSRKRSCINSLRSQYLSGGINSQDSCRTNFLDSFNENIDNVRAEYQFEENTNNATYYNNDISEIGDLTKKTSTFLTMLIKSEERRLNYKSGGCRYSNALKLFSTYLFIVGGRIAFETLSANLPLPSISTVLRTIRISSTPLIEGSCRTIDLKNFLHRRYLLPVV